jgi:hypothetical protein
MPDPTIKVEVEATLIEILSLLHPDAKKNSLRRMIDQIKQKREYFADQ